MASAPPAAPTSTRRNTLLHRAVRWFLAGVFVILPVAITVSIIAWVAGLIRQLVGPDTPVGELLRSFGLHFVSSDALAYVVGVILVLAVIFAIGMAADAGARNLIQWLFDAVLKRIPIVGSVYGTSKQIVSMLDQKDASVLSSMKVVFCYFGKETGAGFLALLVSSERFRINAREYQIVIVPTAPVPIGGGLLFVPAETVQPTDLSVEGLTSIYVSMGITAGQFLSTASRTAPGQTG
jgi:uncharacterized membrane protein